MAGVTFGCGHPRTAANSDSGGATRGPKCKICKRAGTMRWFAKHPGWHRQEQQKLRKRRIDPLLKSQHNLCAICKRLLKHPYEDHNHSCKDCPNRVNGCVRCRRGLLCPSCKGGLHLVESKRLLASAIAYLTKWA